MLKKMCFSQPASLGFGLLGMGTGLFLRARGHPTRRYALFMYFALMEFIQFGVSLWSARGPTCRAQLQLQCFMSAAQQQQGQSCWSCGEGSCLQLPVRD